MAFALGHVLVVVGAVAIESAESGQVMKLLKSSTRLINIPDLGHIVIELTESGVSFRVQGQRLRVEAGWMSVIMACRTPGNVPAFLEGRPLDALRHSLVKSTRKAQIRDAARNEEN